MKTFLDLVESAFGALGTAGRALVSFVLLVVMALLVLMIMSWRLGLVAGGFFLLLGALIIIACSLLLYRLGDKLTSKAFLFGATATMALLVAQHYSPGLLHLGAATGQSADEDADAQAELLETPRKTACTPPFFVGQKGASRYWYAPSAHPVICFVCSFCDKKEKGFDPDNHEKLIPVTPDVIDIIKKEEQEAGIALQPPTPTPAPITPTPTAVPMPTLPQPTVAPPQAEIERPRLTEQPKKLIVPAGIAIEVAIQTAITIGVKDFDASAVINGILMEDVVDKNGAILAQAEAPVGLSIAAMRENQGRAEIRFETVSLTTTSGVVLPIRATSEWLPLIQSRKGVGANAIKGAAGGALATFVAKLATNNRHNMGRDVTAGTAVGAGAGALLTQKQYILYPCRFSAQLSKTLVVPRAMLLAPQQ